MIEIKRYPRLGTHGWIADITVNGETRSVLRVGTRAQIEQRASQVEAEMAAIPIRSQSPYEARARQAAVRHALYGAP